MQFNTEKPKGSGFIHPITNNISRIIANNPSPFTFTGTATYIIGQKELAVLDPGPAEDTQHLDVILRAIGERPLKAIIVSHTHIDHSPLARRLQHITGAPIVGSASYLPPENNGQEIGLDASHDREHLANQVLNDGDLIEGSDWCLETIETPGHAANHLSFALTGTDILFSADHVMGWSTTIVAPPDGNMADYIASLDKILVRQEETYLPGHGDIIKDARRFTKAIKSHRLMRERIIVQKLSEAASPQSLEILVKQVYPNIASYLIGAASLSLTSHLDKLISEEKVIFDIEAQTAQKIYKLNLR